MIAARLAAIAGRRRSRTDAWPACCRPSSASSSCSSRCCAAGAPSEFLALSIELYGAVDPGAARRGRGDPRLVAPPAAPSAGDRSTPTSSPRRPKPSSTTTGRSHPDLEAHVEIRDGQHRGHGVERRPARSPRRPASRAAPGRTRCSSTRSARTSSPTSTASHQPLRLLGGGLAGHDETQEGLAVLAEYLVGGLTRGGCASSPPGSSPCTRWSRACVPRRASHELVDSGVPPARRSRSRCGCSAPAASPRTPSTCAACASSSHHVGPAARSTCCGWARCRSPTSPLVEELRDRGVLDRPAAAPRYLDRPRRAGRLADIIHAARSSPN